MYKPSACFKRFYIAGFGFYDGAQVLGRMKVGDKVKLVPEFDNPYDPEAVAIYYKGKKIGFVPRDMNTDISLLCRFGHADVFTVRVVAVQPDAPVHKQVEVRVDVRDATKKK